MTDVEWKRRWLMVLITLFAVVVPIITALHVPNVRPSNFVFRRVTQHPIASLRRGPCFLDVDDSNPLCDGFWKRAGCCM